MGSSLVDKYSKEELKEIVANSYSKRELLNKLRKWCKTFNLPTHKTEIKNYTDEEWLKI